MSYIELHAASAFSFLQGASLPETLVERAAALGYPALALLDADGVYGAPRFHKAAQKAGLRAIIGAELTISAVGGGRSPSVGRRPSAVGRRELPELKCRSPQDDCRILSAECRSPADHRHPTADGRVATPDGRAVPAYRPPPTAQWILPVLVESQQGYQNLCRLVTRMKMRAAKGEGALALDELDGFTTGLVALAGRPLLDARHHGVGGLLDRLVGVFGRSNVFVELQRHLLRDEEEGNASLVTMASAFRVPIVATNGVRFAEAADRPLFDVLTCVRHKTTLDAAGRRLARNAERYLKSPEAMAQLFADRPQALAGTAALAERLQYTMEDLGYRFPKYPVPSGETEMSFLRHITDIGARERFRPYHEKARAQIARELALIEKLNLAGYFLIVWDIVNYCRQQDVLVQGRGSAANSAVCYSLGITAIDPIKMDLLFERFLSEERGEWPDIDLDLPSGDRRERVIQHVYEKYGRLGAAMTANVITYRSRSAAREVGKALSLDADQIDTLAKVMNNFEFVDPTETLGRNVAAAGLSLDVPRMRTFAELWLRIQDLPRHLGQHSGGMVICQGELDAVVPLEPATMPGRVVIQWDKDDCADMGIVKVDLLGLGMMAVLQDAMEMVNESGVGRGPSAVDDNGAARLPDAESRQPSTESPLPTADGLRPTVITNRRQLPDAESRMPVAESREPSAESPPPAAYRPPPTFDLAHMNMDDPAVYELLQKADTIGVFQVESRAQMATLPRLAPKEFYDLVVEVAIIRPGPIVGNMVHPYLNRRAGREPVVPLHPSLEPVLARTLGVPLFQEQLLRMAMVAAGFTGGQAEELRRAMGFKRSEKRMRQIEVQLREGMARNGITGATAETIITSITSFALYGFPESHAASFALLAYASAFLKVHYPAAFYTALLNNQPMGFYHPATLVKDAQRRGVRFYPIDVQQSDWLCTIEDGAIRLGLMYVNGLRKEIGQAMAAFTKHGPIAPPRCAKCGSDDESMIEVVGRRPAGGIRQSAAGSRQATRTEAIDIRRLAVGPYEEIQTGVPAGEYRLPAVEVVTYFCNTCAHEWSVKSRPAGRFQSIEQIAQRTGLRRDELATLADIGALNAFTHERRSALWQVERAVRRPGPLFNSQLPTSNSQRPDSHAHDDRESDVGDWELGVGSWELDSPLPPMDESERLRADYGGMGLTIGPHPMAMRRHDLSMRGVTRAADLAHTRNGRRVRVAGMVITRQRPGTAKGFVFLTLEDETGISNIIVRPDLFDRERMTIIRQPFLLVDGVLQNLEGVLSIKAERVEGIDGAASVDAHDFY